MNRPTIRAQSANTRLIYYALIFGFAMLLSSLWYIGNYSTEKLGELRSRAAERTGDYNKRLRLAIELRAQTERVIAEARYFRGARDSMRFGSSAPPFRIKLNEAKVELGKLLAEGERYYAACAETPTTTDEECQAWRKIEQSSQAFFQILLAEQRRAPEPKAAASPTPLPTPSAAPSATPPAEPARNVDEQQQQDQEFYESRNQLALAAQGLSEVVIRRQQNAFESIRALQEEAAAQVNGRWWMTFLVSWGVAVVTYVLAQQQVRQIREAKNNAQEADGLTTSVLNSLSNDVLAFNEQGAVLTVNPAFLKDFNLTREECLQQDYRTLLSHTPELRAFVEQAAQNSSPQPARREHIQLKPEDTQTDFQIFNVDVAPRLVGSEARGHVVVLTDVTEAERIREEANRNRTLSTVGQLTAQVAHEIYNPLGAIKLNVDLLEMQLGEQEDDIRHTVARLKRGLEHLSTIVMDLRYLTRPREPERHPTEINRLLDEVIELAGDRLERSRVVVKRAYATERLLGEYDPLQLRKVFLNLLINAVEASPQAGTIELQTERLPSAALGNTSTAQRDAIAVSVLDHGTGMSPETKRRVFEAFYTTKQHGTGLGMMITQEIIKKHGGKIEVESEEGQGTKVSVYLPL